ncbi:amidohydrolase family protein [Aquirufa nivalisilvae]|nr:amidohydrolase family protein [Aquirufa nivalisilvae]
MMKHLLFCALLISSPLFAQEKTMSFEEYDPVSTLKVPEHQIKQAKYPFIDIHNHQFNMPNQDLAYLLKQMDSLNMKVMVNLSGKGSQRGADIAAGTAYLAESARAGREKTNNRVVVFTNLSFANIDSPDWTAKTVAALEAEVKAGALGLKIYKDLGLEVKDSKGNRLATNDPRLDPVWAKCGELNIPVLIHTGEPISFFDVHDKTNERWLELKQFPGRARPSSKYPSWQVVMDELTDIIRKHPKTKFIAAHLAWRGNDLAELGRLLDTYPNMYTEIGAVIHELGRQPKNARKFMIQYQDRVLFGKDIWATSEYYTYFRLLETDDEYFPYYRKRHAFWRIYGLALPDEVLKKVYYKNALNLLPKLDKSQFPK